MTNLRKDAPGSAPGGYTWDGPDDVVDVPPALAHELLRQPDGGFHEVFESHEDETGGDLPHKKADLVALAAELGLDTDGTAKEIAARIIAHRETESHEDETGGDDGENGDEGDATRTPVTEPDPNAQ